MSDIDRPTLYLMLCSSLENVRVTLEEGLNLGMPPTRRICPDVTRRVWNPNPLRIVRCNRLCEANEMWLTYI